MNYIDIIIGIVLLIALVFGWRQGLVRQLFGLLALFLGVYCAYRFSGFTAHYLHRWFAVSEAATGCAAFALTFVVVLVCVVLVGRIADKFIKMIAFGFVNHLLGAVLGVCKTALILGVCIVIVDMFRLFTLHSWFYDRLEALGTLVFPYLWHG
jgi:membrane protein required for colicin V production